MYKKLLISLSIFTFLIFSFTLCFANNGGDMLKDATNGVRNVVGATENTVENVARDVSNTSKDVTNKAENTANNVGNMTSNKATKTNNARTNTYTATRTSTDGTTNTFMGMNATAWTWLIIGIAAIAIVALVWYYAMQMRSSNYNDRD